MSAILENSAVLLIIGALVGILPNYFLNKQNNNHALNMLQQHLDEERKKEILVKKENAYLQFMEFRAITAQMAEVYQSEKYSQEQKSTMQEIYMQNFLEGVRNSSKFMPLISLYGSKAVSTKCGEFSMKYQEIATFDIKCMINEYEEIISLIQKDLCIND